MIQLFCSASTETFWSSEGAALLVDLALELLPLNFRGRPMVRWKAKRKNYKASYSTKSAGACERASCAQADPRRRLGRTVGGATGIAVSM